MKQIIKKLIIICVILSLAIYCLIYVNRGSNNITTVNTQIDNNITYKDIKQPNNDIEAKAQIDNNIVNEPFDSSIENIDINGIIDTLCSDKFEGREVGTKGNEYTVDYMVQTFKKL